VLSKAAGRCLIHKYDRLSQIKAINVYLKLAVKLLEVWRESSLLDFLKCLRELKLNLLDRAGVFFVIFLVEEIVDVLGVKRLNPFLNNQGLV